MPTISDIFDKPTPLQAEIGRDMAAFGGFGPTNTASGGTQYRFMGGAHQSARLAARQARAAVKYQRSGMSTAAKASARLAGKAAWGTAKRAFLPGLGLYFAGSAAVSGFKDGGITGAAAGVAKEAVWWGVGTVVGRGILAAGSAAIANPLAAGLIGTAAVTAGGAAYGAYRGAEAAWQYHMKSLPLETTGSLSAFQTSGAATMRQRSMMNIQRSHLNARSAFGNEAQYLHIARYRGVGRRGTM